MSEKTNGQTILLSSENLVLQAILDWLWHGLWCGYPRCTKSKTASKPRVRLGHPVCDKPKSLPRRLLLGTVNRANLNIEVFSILDSINHAISNPNHAIGDTEHFHVMGRRDNRDA